MIEGTNPWSTITRPESGANYNVLLMQNLGNSELLWGKDQAGHCLFLITLEGDHTKEFQKNILEIKGIGLDLRQMEKPNTQAIVMTLDKSVDRDLFASLCQTLGGTLKNTDSSKNILYITFTHLKRWKSFFSGKSVKKLSKEEVRGLFGELFFLRELLASSKFDQLNAIDSWKGADKGHQDFCYLNRSVEIKTVSGTERNKVTISSEDQLESLSEELFLRVYTLQESNVNNPAMSLNAMVNSIYEDLSDPSAEELFDEKLADYGYTNLKDYDSPLIVVSNSSTYIVEGDFPRLIRSELKNGLVDVNYAIQLEHILDFKTDERLI